MTKKGIYKMNLLIRIGITTLGRKGESFALLIPCLLALLIAGCASTFLISKDCKTYFFGEANDTTYKMLCLSGDIARVLEGTALPPETKVAIYRSTCADRSKGEVQKIYAGLSSEQRRDFRFSFQKQGYQVNAKPISNFKYAPFAINPDFCFPD
ncbi:MAG: hypothetical protein ACM3ON_08410 [Chloroflexota bacterium]